MENDNNIYINELREHARTLGELVIQSEQRIDRTNAMVDKLCSSVTMLTNVYSKHLESLADCRDNLVEQNGKLLVLLEQAQNDTRHAHSLMEKSRDDVMRLIERMVSRSSVNIDNNIK